MVRWIVRVGLGCAVMVLIANGWALDYPGASPGGNYALQEQNDISLHNDILSVTWNIADDTLRLVRINDRITGQSISLDGREIFRLTLADGKEISSSEFHFIEKPKYETINADLNASILAHHDTGLQWKARLRSPDKNIHVIWRAVLREGGNAIRQEITLSTYNQPVAIHTTQMVDIPGENANVAGTVPGSPIVSGTFFFTYEHPDTQNSVVKSDDGTLLAQSLLPFDLELKSNRSVTQSSAMGVVPEGQLRRGFLYYIERERAHPYRPFLHYNSWYDICWAGVQMNEKVCLDSLEGFGQELIQKRHVPLASFVWDDGWDDPNTLWRPSQTNFPNGFDKILAAAQNYNTTLGFWLSPFGGYGEAAKARIAMGTAQGFEIGPQGFSLAGPHYYERFLETCQKFITKDGANFFKFDGLARSVDETEAMLRLTRSLRALKPDLFISITTGTWPSPFWLWYGDSTWRGGGDMGWHGEGSKREQWITYRDMETYRRMVLQAPLYPLNSIMNQGFAHARYGSASECGTDPIEIRSELRSLFAGGTCLQELYVTPSMMTQDNWDDLAETALWSHANADVLVDTHWIGGDPGEGQVYGWASWSPRKSILALRNPSSKPASITIDIAQAFEIPTDQPTQFTLKSPWKSDAERPAKPVHGGEDTTFDLQPFEVLVFDAIP